MSRGVKGAKDSHSPESRSVKILRGQIGVPHTNKRTTRIRITLQATQGRPATGEGAIRRTTYPSLRGSSTPHFRNLLSMAVYEKSKPIQASEHT